MYISLPNLQTYSDLDSIRWTNKFQAYLKVNKQIGREKIICLFISEQ